MQILHIGTYLKITYFQLQYTNSLLQKLEFLASLDRLNKNHKYGEVNSKTTIELLGVTRQF